MQIHLEGDRLTQRPRHDLLKTCDQIVDVLRLHIERLPPCEGKQAVGERGSSPSRGRRCIKVAVQVIRPTRIETPTDKIEPCRHAGQHVVEVMSNATGELPDRLHLLALTQLFLSSRKRLVALQPFGNVAGHSSRRGPHPELPSRPAIGTVRHASETAFGILRSIRLRKALPMVSRCVVVVRVLQSFRISPDDLIGRASPVCGSMPD